MKRVVTGWDESGKPVVLFEGEPPFQVDFGFASAREIWASESSPADTRRSDDPTAGEWTLAPPTGGSVFRTATYAPGADVGIHATETLDYLVVVSGELTLVLEDRELTLRPGDTVVQQATPHGWANRTTEPCVVAAVLLDAARE
ncbi:MAG: cupin domain-containing protein [Gaiellaceae bacterium]